MGVRRRILRPGFFSTLDGGSERMKTQNPISQKEMGFSFFRAKNQKVILDKDPSRLYGIETQALKCRNVSFWPS